MTKIISAQKHVRSEVFFRKLNDASLKTYN